MYRYIYIYTHIYVYIYTYLYIYIYIPNHSFFPKTMDVPGSEWGEKPRVQLGVQYEGNLRNLASQKHIASSYVDHNEHSVLSS